VVRPDTEVELLWHRDVTMQRQVALVEELSAYVMLKHSISQASSVLLAPAITRQMMMEIEK